MEEGLTNLNLLDEEEDAFHEEATVVDQNYQFYLETIAKQFGDFLGQFIEYDTSILTTEIKKFICIRVPLDVSLPLKRKKKILIGKERTVYACFQYEKPNGLECSRVDMEKDNKNRNSGKEHDVGRNTMGVMEKTSLNPIFIPLESVQHILLKGNDSWRNMGSRDLNGVVSAGEPMDLVLTEENDPLISLEGKKRQRIVGVSITSSGNNIERGSFNLTTSSTGQSS
ncbi:hypothetical protein Goarm_022281 [Gossypium armourianum]|uniref:Uncharacterized protein n=1 Tax=Gossypium armourianum TaxID=34283 RepID=A0A7J9KGM4_9ROSI|nr:hypothetical protein [Gossypium armourianum]